MQVQKRQLISEPSLLQAVHTYKIIELVNQFLFYWLLGIKGLQPFSQKTSFTLKV